VKRNLTYIFFLLLLNIFATRIPGQITAQFIDLGPGGAAKVSNNGIYVCGNNYPAPAFLWSQSAGRISLGSGSYSEAQGVSDDGIVAGTYRDPDLPDPGGNPTYRAGYYQNNQWNALPGYPGYPVLDSLSYTYSYGISEDGFYIVGMQWVPGYRTEAVYWDSLRTIHLLGRTGGGSSNANDIAVTSSGFRIVGWDGDFTGPDRRAFYWDPQPHYMGGYDTTYPVGQCYGINSGGSKIVGGTVGVPFVWTETSGIQWITIAYQNSASYAKDISDNNIIVGYVSPGVGSYQAFIKRPEWQDISFLKDYLIDTLGITGISDWFFPFANSISADGLTIVGTAYPPSGVSHAFIVKLNNPVPVELTSFTASYHDSKVMISWTTNSEVNNRGFDIERKTRSSKWDKIGFDAGNGTTTQSKSYSFTDDLTLAHTLTHTLHYRLKQIDLDGKYKYSNEVEVNINIPAAYSLDQNYPNPFNPTTKISFSVPQNSNVKLSAFNILGEKVTTLINEVKNSGTYEINYDAGSLASGIYVYKLEAVSVNGQASGYVSSKKMILIK
jgi:Secretion system C-terminal sorting domain